MSPKIIIVLVLVILFLIFIFQNLQTVIVNFLVFELSMPRALLLIVTFAVGFVVGIFRPYELLKKRTKK